MFQPKGVFFTGQGCLLIIGVKVKQGAGTTNFFDVVSFIDCHVSTSWNFVIKIFRIRTWYIGAIEYNILWTIAIYCLEMCNHFS